MSQKGFREVETLQELFTRVDGNKSGTIGFGEFLSLLYFWAEVGPYSNLFPTREAEAVDTAFRFLEKSYLRYDADKSRSLSRDELNTFVSEYFGEIPKSLGELCDLIFPKDGDHIGFTRFLMLLYHLTVPSGRYLIRSRRHSSRDGSIRLEETELWQLLDHAFTVLEKDFRAFDKDGDNSVDLSELTNALENRNSEQLVDILSRLTYIFDKVDLDKSGAIDFPEFLYLVYLLVENGSYKQVIENAVDAGAVKKSFLFLRKSYSKYDDDKNSRLDRKEVSAFLKDYFGTVPSSFEDIFMELETPGKGHIDFVRFLQLLYEMIRPTSGFYVGKKKKPVPKKQEAVRSGSESSMVKLPKLQRVENLQLSEVKNSKKIGEGGFGIVYKAEFRSHIVAAKYLKGDYSKEVLEEFKAEVNLMQSMDHKNLVFMLGAAVEPPNLCIVTEYCSHGSLFDVLHKERRVLHESLIWSIAHGVASGCHVLHTMNPPIIHRDLKSLNVLLDQNWVAKVCDFGLSKKTYQDQTHTAGIGTPQWTAPEVMTSPNYDTKADVFSFGILLWEMTHREIPFKGYEQIQVAMNVVRGARPHISRRKCPEEFARLMERCWATDPRQRPPFSEVLKELDAIKSKFVQ
eukprot:TRINITY_DN5256_c0_g1_i2.p1 TRINITY_DN5256_c0_g1~~TRINITY_DN5256_c0_g1_i2.p1  ORF type:complete len:627 (-),score=122.51 TRINITY_DN5256_c0_g1_i2:1775-3655(-)